MQTDRENDEKYINWTKASLFLYHVKQGLAPIAQDESYTLHNHLRQHVQRVQQNLSTHSTCTRCTSLDIKRTNQKTSAWRMSCPICSVYMDEMQRLHNNSGRIVWGNTNPTLWSSQPWEVAKVYQPRGCTTQNSAQEADVAALLTFFSDCTLFNDLVSDPQLLREIKAIRNNVMHSANLEVSSTDLKAWSDKMIALLEDKRHFVYQRSCQIAVKNIQQLLVSTSGQHISAEEEVIALEHRREVSRQDLDDVQSLINQVKAELKPEIDTLKTQMTTAEQNIQKLDVCQSETTIHLSHVDGQLTKHDVMLKQLCDDVQNVVKGSEEVPDNAHIVEPLYERLNTIHTEIESDRARIETRKQELSEETRKLQSVSDDINIKIQTLRDLAQTLRSSKISQTLSIPDQDTVECVKGLQRKLISIYNEHCCRIPISPMIPEKTMHVDDMYVAPNLELVGSHKSSMATNEIETAYSDILMDGEKTCKNVYITGEAGVGKSAFCESMVNAWCRAHSRGLEYLSANERIMLTFPLLFYISLRNAVNQSSIEEMIQSQLTSTIPDCLSTVKCLVLLDGLDEWKQPQLMQCRFLHKDLPQRPVCNNCTFVTTSRSWKFETLRLKRNEVDKHVRVVGLDSHSSEKLAKCVIDIHNKDKNQEYSYEKFKTALVKQKIDHFIHVPLVLLQLLCLWFDGKPFGKTQCEIYANIVEHQFKYADENRRRGSQSEFQTFMKVRLPKCFKQKKLCQKYISTLHALSKFAFETLCSGVSYQNEQDQTIDKDDKDACLQSGFLTQESLDDSFSERHTNMNFSHRTYHQFFAAVYLAMSVDNLNDMFKKICTLDNFVEIPDLFVFVLEMNPIVGSSLLEYIMKSVATDDRLHNNRRSFTNQVAPSVVAQLQNVLMNIFEECDRSGNSNLKVSLPDIKVDQRNITHIDKHINKLMMKNVKSLQMQTSESTSNKKPMYKKIFEQCLKSHVLEKLHLKDANNFISQDAICKSLKDTKRTLRTLHLEHVDLSELNNSIINVFKIDNLESLCLRYISLKHNQIELISTFPFKGEPRVVREVHLEGFRCIEHGSLNRCRYSIDLSITKPTFLRISDMDIANIRFSNVNLESIEIVDLFVAGAFGSIFEQLVRAPVLHTIQVKSCKNNKDIEKLLAALPTIENLKSLELSRADIGRHSLSLFPVLKNVQCVVLSYITISRNELVRFVDSLSLPFLTTIAGIRDKTVDVRLENLTILNEDLDGEFDYYIQHSDKLKIFHLQNGWNIQATRHATVQQ